MILHRAKSAVPSRLKELREVLLLTPDTTAGHHLLDRAALSLRAYSLLSLIKIGRQGSRRRRLLYYSGASGRNKAHYIITVFISPFTRLKSVSPLLIRYTATDAAAAVDLKLLPVLAGQSIAEYGFMLAIAIATDYSSCCYSGTLSVYHFFF